MLNLKFNGKRYFLSLSLLIFKEGQLCCTCQGLREEIIHFFVITYFVMGGNDTDLITTPMLEKENNPEAKRKKNNTVTGMNEFATL